jgi:two-component system, NarL family, response regulator LiaR
MTKPIKPIQVLIADDHAVVRDGLTAIIASDPALKLAGQAVNGAQAVELARALQPDVILLDLMMPVKDGLSAIADLRRDNPAARILVLTGYAEDDKVFPAIKAGALGYMLKDAPREQLLQAIHHVAAGRVSLHPHIALKVMQELQQPSNLPPTAAPLTPRELETISLIARGLSNQQIAAELSVHERTVVKYVGSILDKLHLANRTQAALYALRQGWAEL